MKSKRVVAGLVASVAGSMAGVGAVIVSVVGPQRALPVVDRHGACGTVDRRAARLVGDRAGLYASATQTLHDCDTHYNFFVDRYGQIFEGRFGSVWDPVRAAHATESNTGSVGVALIGNFQNEPPPAAAITALENLLAWKLNWHGVDPTRRFGGLHPFGRPRTFRAVPTGRDSTLRAT